MKNIVNVLIRVTTLIVGYVVGINQIMNIHDKIYDMEHNLLLNVVGYYNPEWYMNIIRRYNFNIYLIIVMLIVLTGIVILFNTKKEEN